LFLCVCALLAISAPAYATVITAMPVNISAVAGTSFTGTVATFTDSNPAATPASFIAIINWGDGSTSAGTISGNGQPFIVTGTHTYAAPGTPTVTVTISDAPPGTGSATVTETATVAGSTVITATPVNFSAVAGTSFTKTVATFTDSNPAATPASFIAIINWGDASISAGTISGNGQPFTVTGTHTYAAPGTLTVTVTISDAPPGTGSATVTETATVASPTLPPTITKAFADSELQLFGAGTALSFAITNPNTATTLTSVSFTDTLPSGLVVSTPNGLTAKCGLFLPGGGITAVAGSNSISLSGATLAAGASCTFSVNVTGVAIGVQTNTTSTVTSNEAQPGAPATASISVDFLYFYWFFAA
jgi:PKD repeat protein